MTFAAPHFAPHQEAADRGVGGLDPPSALARSGRVRLFGCRHASGDWSTRSPYLRSPWGRR